ncbi:MAG: ankyrin repeat domain-containing protein [Gammaproteobacteria bacterium]
MLSESLAAMYLNASDKQRKDVALQREFFAICKAAQIQKNREDHSLTDHEKVLQQVKQFFDTNPDFYPGVDYVGFTPAHYLAGRGNVITMAYLAERFPRFNWDVSHDQGWSPVVNACYFGQLQSLKFLIDKGVNLHPNLSGKTLAHVTAFRQNPNTSVEEFSASRKPIFDLLHNQGVDLESQDARGQTALDVMAYSLFSDAETQDPFGRTYLHWAAYMPKLRDVPELNVLINDRDVVQQCDEYGKSALLYAAVMGDENFFQRLLPLSDVNAQGIGGTTALHYAASKPMNINMVRTLLALGLDPLQRDKLGQSSFDIAFKCGCDQVLRILQEHILINDRDSLSLLEEYMPETQKSFSISGQVESGDSGLTIDYHRLRDISINTLSTKSNESSSREYPKP